MGLLNGIKNIVNNSDKEAELKNKRSARLQTLFRCDNINNAEIILSIVDEIKNNKEISFGENIDISGTSTLFHIDLSAETFIMCICKKKGLLKGDNATYIIFTDMAIYLHPDIVENTSLSSNRISISKLCQYIIYENASDGVISLCSENEEIIIYKKAYLKAYFSNNNEITLLHQIIYKIQQYFVNKSITSKKERLALINWLKKYTEQYVRTNKFDRKIERLTTEIKKEPLFHASATLLLLKIYLYRRCPVQFSETINDYNKEYQTGHISITEDFHNIIKQYKRELFDLSVKFEDTCLRNADFLANNTISMEMLQEVTSEKEELLKQYNQYSLDISYALELRKNPHMNQVEFVESLNFNQLSKEKRNEYLVLYFCSINSEMQEVYKQLTTENNTYLKINVEWKDGYGLSPLHYALLLHNQDAVDYFIKKLDGPIVAIEETEEFEAITMYGIVAALTDNVDAIASLVLISEEIVTINKTEKILKRKINAKKALVVSMEFTSACVKSALNQGGDEISDEQRCEQESNIETVQGNVKSYKTEIEALESQLDELDKERERIIWHVAHKWQVQAERLEKSASGIIQMYISLYRNPELLYNSLKAAPASFYITEINDQYLFIYDEIFNEENYQDDAQEEKKTCFEQNYKVEKPYKDSWFSPEAHLNEYLLIKEFHKLAVTYHPDNNPDTLQTFIEIEAEKASILETIPIG